MKRLCLIALVGLLLLLPACCTMPVPQLRNHVIVTALCPDLVEGANEWVPDVAPKYPNALIVAVHGGVDPLSGKWYAYPTLSQPLPVAVLVKLYRLDYPNRHIVLICCNPGHKVLHGVHNVSYALDDVWVHPDVAVGLGVKWYRDSTDPQDYGDISEFVNTRR